MKRFTTFFLTVIITLSLLAACSNPSKNGADTLSTTEFSQEQENTTNDVTANIDSRETVTYDSIERALDDYMALLNGTATQEQFLGLYPEEFWIYFEKAEEPREEEYNEWLEDGECYASRYYEEYGEDAYVTYKITEKTPLDADIETDVKGCLKQVFNISETDFEEGYAVMLTILVNDGSGEVIEEENGGLPVGKIRGKWYVLQTMLREAEEQLDE